MIDRYKDRKYCNGCKGYVARSEFTKRTSSPDGLHYICKKCSREKSNENYHKNTIADYRAWGKK